MKSESGGFGFHGVPFAIRRSSQISPQFAAE
jgi:hypothetical protein